MFYFWIFLGLLVIIGGILARRRPTASADDAEPWRASLRDEDDDAPLDMNEIRNAEEEWLASDPWESDSEDSDWR